jgi:glycosyltransferase involved in cell wall biosynthesis
MSKQLTLGYISNSPLAYEGEKYRSKSGHWNYVEKVSELFDKVDVFARVKKVDKSNNKYRRRVNIENANFHDISKKNTNKKNRSSIAENIKQFRYILERSKSWSFGFYMAPGWAALMGALASRVHNIPYAACFRGEWDGIVENRIEEKYNYGKLKNLIKLPIKLIQYMILKNANIKMTEGYVLVGKYKSINRKKVIPTLTSDLSKKDFAQKSKKRAKSKIKISWVGSMIRRKRPSMAVKVVNKINKMCKHNVELEMIGDGVRKTELERKIRKMGIEGKINMRGYISSKSRLLRVIKKCDMHLVTSDSEGFPRVIWEAQSQHVPVVSTRVGGVPEFLEDRAEVMLASDDSVESVASCVRKLIENTQLRGKIAKKGYRRAKKFVSNKRMGRVVNSFKKEIRKIR